MGESVYRKGYVDVGGGHKVYFECFGNQKSQPILFIHGGPGSGFTESHKKLFNTARFNVIFYDQRGAGKSKPYLSLEENTTQNLIEDIEKLRNFLQLEKLILIGSSWGATLALLYAIQYPQRVMGMVLMSVFLATRNEIENLSECERQSILNEYTKKYNLNDQIKKLPRYQLDINLSPNFDKPISQESFPTLTISKFCRILESFSLSKLLLVTSKRKYSPSILVLIIE